MARQLGISPSQSGPTKLSAEAREKIAKALRINPNASAVAREIGGIDPSTVSAIAKKAGIQLAAVTIGKRKRLSPQTRARIVEALAANPNASRVAREVGDVSARTVGKIAKEANIRLAAENPEKRKRLSPEKRARIVAALRADPNASVVARQIGGVSAKTVQKIAKQAKIELAALNGRGTPALAQTGRRSVDRERDSQKSRHTAPGGEDREKETAFAPDAGAHRRGAGSQPERKQSRQRSRRRECENGR